MAIYCTCHEYGTGLETLRFSSQSPRIPSEAGVDVFLFHRCTNCGPESPGTSSKVMHSRDLNSCLQFAKAQYPFLQADPGIRWADVPSASIKHPLQDESRTMPLSAGGPLE